MMKTLIIGAGSIGTAIAYYLAKTPVNQITLIDKNNKLIEHCAENFGAPNISMCCLNIFSSYFLLQEHEVVISTLPWDLHRALAKICQAYPISLLSVARPDHEYFRHLSLSTNNMQAQIIHGLGLEPGLCDLLTQHLAHQFTLLDDIFISCGAIPADPLPPMNYRSAVTIQPLFFSQKETLKITQGELQTVSRFSEPEELLIEQMGALECWHDGLTPWLAQFLQQKGILNCSHKTIRWPGFATIINFLHAAGGMALDTWVTQQLFPQLQLAAHEVDMVILGIWAKGYVHEKMYQVKFQLIDYKDTTSGLSAIARTAGFCTALIAQFLYQHKIFSPGERMLTDFYSENLVYYIIQKLSEEDVKVDIDFNEDN